MRTNKRIQNFKIPIKSEDDLVKELNDLNKKKQESDSIIEKQSIKRQQKKIIKEMKESVGRKY